ncbi:MAG: ribosomal protein S18-alanine N-acetyltransferase [Thermodesulfovibrionales bacterium]
MDKSFFNIQSLTLEDVNRITSISKDFVELQWTDDSFIKEIYNKNSICLKAVAEDNIIGYIIASLIFDECHIINLFVRKSFRQKGVGSALISTLLDKIRQKAIKRIFLELRLSNTEAVKLYQKYGFIRVAIRKNLYVSPSEDGLFMVKEL